MEAKNIDNSKKYRLDDTDSIDFNGHILYRIVALKDFSIIKAGDKGGYIESEKNLSHNNDAWIFDNAKVYGFTQVAGNAKISGDGELNVNDTINKDVVLGSEEVHKAEQVVETNSLKDRKKTTFKEWFGGYDTSEPVSKVVDSWGVPIKVYHSTIRKGINKFQNFNTDKPVWFTPNKEYSKRYYSTKKWYQKGDTYTVYLNLKNPLNVGNIDRPLDDGWKFHRNDWYDELSKKSRIPYEIIEERLKPVKAVWVHGLTNTKEFKELLQEYGYDGIKAKERGFISYAAFQQEQIRKSSDVHFRKKDYILSEETLEDSIDDTLKYSREKISDKIDEKKIEEKQAKEERFQTYKKECEQRKKNIINDRFNPYKIIGTITTLNKFGIDTAHNNNKQDFLKALEKSFKKEDSTMWSFEILSSEPSLRKEVDNVLENIDNGKKYRLDDTDSIDFNGHILYRIVALKDFADVKAGDKGGYVESEDNLSHDGAAWVYDNAQVFDKAKVSDNAQVKDNAHVHGYTQVAGNARISGYGELNVNDTITEDVALDFGRNASASESESLSVEESRRKGLSR